MMRAAAALALAGALAGALPGCASPNRNLKVPAGEEIVLGRTSFSFDREPGSYELLRQYRIKPGDLLDVLYQINTWGGKETFTLAVEHTVNVKFPRASELDTAQRVRPDGTISLPYIGSIPVLGKTVPQVEAELKERYARVLRRPEVHVVVPEFRASIKELKADLMTAARGLSRLVRVRPDGFVTFPMVGDTLVAGRTIGEVGAELDRRFQEILPDLHCDLLLEEHSENVVYVVGEVRKPGSYALTRPIAVLQAVALAGSTTEDAEMAGVMVVRRRGEEFVATRVDLGRSLDVTAREPLFFLQPDDIVVVPRTRLSASAQIARYIADIIFFRGWGVQADFGDVQLRD